MLQRKGSSRSLLVVSLLLFWIAACGGEDGLDLPEGDASDALPVAEEAREAAEEAFPDPELVIELARGIDVSAYSGTIDWDRVAADDVDFAFLKATEGVDLLDPDFVRHWTELADTSLRRGAYHFYVTEDDPEEQATFFIDNVELEPGDLAPVVDVELIGGGTQPGLADRLRVFLDRLEGHYGMKPIIYTNPGFWDRHLDDTFGEYPLWVAEYEVDEPTVPAGWGTWTLWQYEADAPIAGVEKGADLSRANDDGLDLTRLIYLGPPADETPTDGPPAN